MESVLQPVLRLIEPFHRMAESADLRRPHGIELLRLYNLAAHCLGVRSPAILLVRETRDDMSLSRTVTGLAGNPQFPGTRIHGARFAVDARFDSGRMTPAAHSIPHFRSVSEIRRTDERRVSRNPS